MGIVGAVVICIGAILYYSLAPEGPPRTSESHPPSTTAGAKAKNGSSQTSVSDKINGSGTASSKPLDPEKARELSLLVGNLRNAGDHRDLLTNLIIANVVNNRALLFEAAKALEGDKRNLVMFQCAQYAIEHGNFDEANDMIAQMPYSRERLNAIQRLAVEWSKRDPKSMIQWISTLDLPEDKDSAMVASLPVMRKLGEVGTLKSYVQQVANANMRESIITATVETLNEVGGAEAAKQWVGSLPDKLKDSGQAKLVALLGSAAPQEWTSAATEIKDPIYRTQAVAALGQALTKNSPAEAEKWALNLPVASRRAGIGSVVQIAYDIDSSQVWDWIQTMPKGGDRDFATERLISRVQSSDRDLAKTLINSIDDQKRREAALRNLNGSR